MKRILFSLLLVSLFASCSKDENQTDNCSELRQAVAEENVTAVIAQVNKLALGIQLTASTSQMDAETKMINELVNRINKTCGIKATVLCYFCIDTLPSQTEIRITVLNGVINMQRTLDIIINNDGQVKCVNMHE